MYTGLETLVFADVPHEVVITAVEETSDRLRFVDALRAELVRWLGSALLTTDHRLAAACEPAELAG